ncbi:OsmC family protein [Bacillus daqingensis]|uniref:OsmC family protein n=1 Tax=Bacillus daqingensis TaxID=872396 RepID=A0ABV9NNP7_9BACI
MKRVDFEVAGTGQGMKTEVASDKHTIVIDEPPAMGGNDEGQDPLTNLLASLAGCENVIAHMVADEMDFNLDKIDFKVSGYIDLRGLQGEEGVKPYFQEVTVKAAVHTDESDERIDELQRKTDARCPVYTTLEAAGIPLQTAWTKA